MATKETKVNTKASKATSKTVKSSHSDAKSAANSKKAATGRPFKPGQSGNPSGRPKIPEDVREACRAASMEAINTLKTIMLNETAKDSDRIKASEIILDRAWGKATQAIELDQIDTTVKIVMDKSLEGYCV